MNDWKEHAKLHAQDEFPREACGLVILLDEEEHYVRCKNKAQGQDHFILDPVDYASAEDIGRVVAVFHSHPNASCKPSEGDLVSCEESGLKWYIIGLPSGTWHEFSPCGYQAPLIGRTFQHGILDCYTLLRDWFKLERGVTLLDFEREDEWWKKGQNLYLENFVKAGFRESTEKDAQPGDVILMQVLSNVTNHAAIYLGDNIILHHVYGRLSRKEVYGGYWRDHTTQWLRYGR